MGNTGSQMKWRVFPGTGATGDIKHRLQPGWAAGLIMN